MGLAEWQEWWKHFGATELRHLLLVWWDPIGIYGIPEALDEYDRYCERIGHQLREGTDAGAIARYLGFVTAELMGLGRVPARDEGVARRIVEWYERAMARDRGFRAQ